MELEDVKKKDDVQHYQKQSSKLLKVLKRRNLNIEK